MKRYSLDRSLPLVTCVLAVAYFAGFLVVNGYYGRVQLIDVEAFRFHYLVAAMLFTITTAVPIAALFLMRQEFRKVWTHRAIWNVKNWRMWPVAFLHWLFLAVGVGLAWMIVMMFIAVGNVSLWWRESLLYLLVVFAAMWFVHHLRKNVLSGWHRAWPNLDLSDFHQILLAAGTFISLAALYGAMVYPHVRSGYGGGAAWIAEISHREGSILPERLQDELRGAAVIGSSGARLRVVTCSMTDHGPEPRLLEVALDEVVVLRLVRPEALPVFLRSCRTAVSNVVETDL